MHGFYVRNNQHPRPVDNMKLSFIALSLIPTVLGEVISPAEPSSDCHADNCYRAVAGDDVRFNLTSPREDCSRFMAAGTATPPSASPTEATAPSHGTPAVHDIRAVVPRVDAEPASSDPAATSTALPVYASLCYSVAAYSSACSCWGITGDKFTADAIPTAVATASTAASSLSSAASPSIPSGNSTSPTPSLPTTGTTRTSLTSSSSPSTVKSSTSSVRSTILSSTIPTTKSSKTTTTPTTSFSSFSSTSTTTISTSTTSTNSTAGGCVGARCGTYKAWPCSGPLGDCLCGIDPNGQSFCFEDNLCSVETTCSLNTDCPTSQRCVIGSCCQVGKCVVERKDGVERGGREQEV
ncbi:hypothetical protein BR93DRAFT_992554 [Coniochaeta sp. PMI_546]|nr:hypothetical protein BR93DRAFT_992554 [Coniochaeta sp. PMI_546]